MKYKVGDKVEVIVTTSPFFSIGDKGIIIESDNSCAPYRIKCDGMTGWTCSDDVRLIKTKQMTKEDLKTGMQVEYRNGERKLVMIGTKSGDYLTELASSGYSELRHFSIDMKNNNDSDRDIMKVYETEYCSRTFHELDDSELVWERKEEVPEYTMSELQNMIGKEFKLKK